MVVRFPAPLVPGDVIAVVAPSSPMDGEQLERGVAWLRERYEVVVGPGILTKDAYLAGDDARRTAELARAMTDPRVKAIVAARGGYGAMRILDALPWDAWAERPSWLVGFSDITALHVIANARGIASIHGPHVTGLGRTMDVRVRNAFRAALEDPQGGRVWADLQVIHAAPGAVHGVVVGGNLALVEAMAASRRLSWPQGAIVVLEDVTERPYRIDRMLTALRLGGYLSHVGAIVFGDFSKCDPGPDGRTLSDVLFERTRDLGVAVLAGAPFGHDERNDAFVLGARATLAENALMFGA